MILERATLNNDVALHPDLSGLKQVMELKSNIKACLRKKCGGNARSSPLRALYLAASQLLKAGLNKQVFAFQTMFNREGVK